jgi:hypothetical protein
VEESLTAPMIATCLRWEDALLLGIVMMFLSTGYSQRGRKQETDVGQYRFEFQLNRHRETVRIGMTFSTMA